MAVEGVDMSPGAKAAVVFSPTSAGLEDEIVARPYRWPFAMQWAQYVRRGALVEACRVSLVTWSVIEALKDCWRLCCSC